MAHRIRMLALVVTGMALTSRARGQVVGRPILGNPVAPQQTTPPIPATFYAIQVTVLNPVSARVDWGDFNANPKAGATLPLDNYQVFRSDLPGQPIAKLPATARTFTDQALHQGQTYTYYITANPAPQVTQRLTGPGTVQGQTAQVTNNNPLPLGTSNLVAVTLPVLQPPTGVTAKVSASAPNTIALSWMPAAYAHTYQVWRNGQLLGRFAADAADVPGSPGWYDYTVQSVLPQPGADLVSAATPSVSGHLGPFTVVIVGGSFVWGEGLTDESKIESAAAFFATTTTLLRPVIVNLSHAGAFVNPPSSDPPRAGRPAQCPGPTAWGSAQPISHGGVSALERGAGQGQSIQRGPGGDGGVSPRRRLQEPARSQDPRQ